jgi:hypothetical protein
MLGELSFQRTKDKMNLRFAKVACQGKQEKARGREPNSFSLAIDSRDVYTHKRLSKN